MSRPNLNLFLGAFPLTCHGPFCLKISLTRRIIFIQRLMKPLLIVLLNVFANTLLTLWDRLIWPEINLFIFQYPPESLDEYIIDHTAFAIHADLNLFFLEDRNEITACKLCALVCVEIFRFSSFQSFFQSLTTEIRFQGGGYPPGNYVATVEIHHSN